MVSIATGTVPKISGSGGSASRKFLSFVSPVHLLVGMAPICMKLVLLFIVVLAERGDGIVKLVVDTIDSTAIILKRPTNNLSSDVVGIRRHSKIMRAVRYVRMGGL